MPDPLALDIGAIVGGVVGGVAALVILGLLLWFFCFRKKRRSAAFDEKTFDPGNRHSVSDPIDLLAPSVPNVGSPTAANAQPGVNSPRVDPFPYGGAAAGAAGAGALAGAAAGSHGSHPGSPEQQAYDPYAAPQPMQFPDARNYMSTGGYGGSYGGGGMDGGYGAAAAGGGMAGGAAAGGYAEGQFDPRFAPSQSAPSNYSRSSGGALSPHGAGGMGQGANVPPVPPLAGAAGMSSGAIAKQREATAERERLRQSAGFQPTSPVAGSAGAGAAAGAAAGGSGAAGAAAGSRSSVDGTGEGDARRSSSGGVYQHTDYGSVPEVNDEGEEEPPTEIPPG